MTPKLTCFASAAVALALSAPSPASAQEIKDKNKARSVATSVQLYFVRPIDECTYQQLGLVLAQGDGQGKVNLDDTMKVSSQFKVLQGFSDTINVCELGANDYAAFFSRSAVEEGPLDPWWADNMYQLPGTGFGEEHKSVCGDWGQAQGVALVARGGESRTFVQNIEDGFVQPTQLVPNGSVVPLDAVDQCVQGIDYTIGEGAASVHGVLPVEHQTYNGRIGGYYPAGLAGDIEIDLEILAAGPATTQQTIAKKDYLKFFVDGELAARMANEQDKTWVTTQDMTQTTYPFAIEGSIKINGHDVLPEMMLYYQDFSTFEGEYKVVSSYAP